jgi:lysozyme
MESKRCFDHADVRAMIRRMRWPALLIVVSACAAHESDVEQEVQQCPTQTVEGIDVYSGQGAVDWMKVKGAGRDFAFIKATQGNYNKQSTFAANWTGAAAAGVLRSPYHFFDGTIDGKVQAQWFLDELNANGGLQPGDLPPMLDLECPTSSSQSAASPNCEYTGNSGWVATATLKQRTYDWLTTVEAATGRKPYIYSYPSWFAGVSFTDAALATYPLFIATYSSCASVPAPWTKAVFWQYSDTGTVSGVSGQVDEDRFIGSAGDLTGQTGSVPPDAGVGAADAGAGGPDAGMSPETGRGGGCGCRATGSGSLAWLVALAGAVMFSVRRKRRRGSSRR